MDRLQTKQQGLLARHYNKDQLAAAMRDARRNLLARVDDLDDAQWRVPYDPGYNPVAWEIGHVAWFAEWWTLRGPHTVGSDGQVQAALPARCAGPDQIFNSSVIPHRDRWQVSLPDRAALYAMLATQLEATLAALAQAGESDADLYFYRLALAHEDMHVEALTYLRDHLAYPAPPDLLIPQVRIEAAQVSIAAGPVQIGQAASGEGFYFDNEKWAYTLALPSFQIDATPISCGAYLKFVEAGGYAHADYWPGAAGQWRATVVRTHPARWRKVGAAWQCRWFDQWLPLSADQPIMHINAYEAEAYCLWAGRRLPSEAEWEAAARQDAITWGGAVWEWMSNAFTPYTGFSPDAYRDYSAPWFGNHRSLRGGSFATHARMHHAQYRNFYLPERSDIFAGFRTCAI